MLMYNSVGNSARLAIIVSSWEPNVNTLKSRRNLGYAQAMSRSWKDVLVCLNACGLWLSLMKIL